MTERQIGDIVNVAWRIAAIDYKRGSQLLTLERVEDDRQATEPTPTPFDDDAPHQTKHVYPQHDPLNIDDATADTLTSTSPHNAVAALKRAISLIRNDYQKRAYRELTDAGYATLASMLSRRYERNIEMDIADIETEIARLQGSYDDATN